MSSVFVRWLLLRISVILQLFCSPWVQHTDIALPSRMSKQWPMRRLLQSGGDAKSETMRVSLLKSVDGRSRRREESIVCVSPFFSLSCFTRYAPPWSLGRPPRSRSQLARSFGALVPVRPRSIAAGSTDASWRLCLAYVQVYKLLFGESRLPKRGKGFEPGVCVRASSCRVIGEGRCR